jgi:hypothetical protein
MQVLTNSQFIARISEIYSNAKLQGLHNTDLQANIDKHIRSEINRQTGTLKKKNVYSVFTQGEVHGMLIGFDKLFYDNLEFCYQFEGNLYSTHQITDKMNVSFLYASGCCMNDLQSGFVYKHCSNKFYGFNK